MTATHSYMPATHSVSVWMDVCTQYCFTMWVVCVIQPRLRSHVPKEPLLCPHPAAPSPELLLKRKVNTGHNLQGSPRLLRGRNHKPSPACAGIEGL